MDVTVSGISMLVKPVQEEKANSPIDVTVSGISMLLKLVQPQKA